MSVVGRIWTRQKPGFRFVCGKDPREGEWKEWSPTRTNNPKNAMPTDWREYDMYFAVNAFDSPRREGDNTLASPWLYADLDEADPQCPDFLRPTIAWETSPGRYQAAWLLDRYLKPDLHRKLNQRVTYLTGADKGGWGLTKVLRIPGTINHKRGVRFKVQTLWAGDEPYEVDIVADLLKSIALPEMGDHLPPLPTEAHSPAQILLQNPVPQHVKKQLHRKPHPQDDRSKVLFKLEGQLLESGLSPEETYSVLLENPWNKFKGRRSKQLWREIHKHTAARQRINGEDPPRRLRGVPFKQFMYSELPKPQWAVDSIWAEEAHGIIAGEAKVYKSQIALDLAVSVASGTKFLDHFPVPKTGPVVIIQKENRDSTVQDRVAKIAYSRDLLDKAEYVAGKLRFSEGQDLPITFFNNVDLNLVEDEDIEELDQILGELKPKLAIMDPWYLLATGVDENSSNQVAPILKSLMDLKLKHDCGMLLVHHYRKPRHDADEGDLERISGTSVFGRWFQSALLVQRGDEPHSSKIVPFHREFPPQSVINVTFDMGEYGSMDYDVDVEIKEEQVKSIPRAVKELVQRNPGITIPRLAEAVGVNADRIRRVVERGSYSTQVKGGGRRGRPAMGVYLRGQK